MIKETKKAPTIRFRDFTDDWEQRKLGDFGAVAMCKRIFKDQTSEKGDIPFYKIGTFGGVPDAYIPRELFNEYKQMYPYPEKGDILISASGSIGRTVEYTGEDAYFQDSNIVWLRHDKSIVNLFLKYLYGVIQWAGIEGSTIKRLYNDNILTTEVMIPSVQEQEKIGAYLDSIDHLITLHQRKLDQLKTLKKYFLQNMFPAKGEKVPRIRFKGFTGDWEQRKVTELGYIYIGLVTTMTSHYSNHGTLLIRNSDIKDSCFEFDKKPIFLDEEFAKQNTSRRHQVGDVITVHTGDIGTSAVITEKEEGSIGFATIVTRPYKEKITSEYLCTYLNTDTHKNFALNISTGDGRNNYNLKDYYECVVPVPRIKEQIKIADFINALNNLITLHQQKLNQLQTMKKFMLQNLFI